MSKNIVVISITVYPCEREVEIVHLDVDNECNTGDHYLGRVW